MRSFCRRSAERPFALRARGLTLIEVMVSQVIGLIIITGMTSLISAMVKKLNAETNVSDAQVKLRDKNAIYANSLIEEVPGILPMRRRKEVTQQSYFNYTFRIDAKELGVNNAAFCAALNAELGLGDAFEMPYDPLHECGLYKPRTKTRHKLNDAFWKAIDPRRAKLPVCHDANQSSGVAVHHVFLMNTKKEMEQLAEACKKIVDNIAEVKKLNIGPKKKYKALND